MSESATRRLSPLGSIGLPVHGDSRGRFKENWQRAKQTALSLRDLDPMQNSISFNAECGVTRGIHAELWGRVRIRGHGQRIRRMGRRALGRCSPAPSTRPGSSKGHAVWVTASGRLRAASPRLFGERPLVRRPEEGLHLREPCRPRAGHLMAHPA